MAQNSSKIMRLRTLKRAQQKQRKNGDYRENENKKMIIKVRAKDGSESET